MENLADEEVDEVVVGKKEAIEVVAADAEEDGCCFFADESVLIPSRLSKSASYSSS